MYCATSVTLSAGLASSRAACSAVACRKSTPLYSSILSPVRNPASSARHPGCTEWTKIPTPFPPTKDIPRFEHFLVSMKRYRGSIVAGLFWLCSSCVGLRIVAFCRWSVVIAWFICPRVNVLPTPRRLSNVTELRILSNVAELRSSGFLMFMSRLAELRISRSLSWVPRTSIDADDRTSPLITVKVAVLGWSRSGSVWSWTSRVVFRGASGLLQGVGEPLRLPASSPPASDELDDPEPSSSLYSVRAISVLISNRKRAPGKISQTFSCTIRCWKCWLVYFRKFFVCLFGLRSSP